jgi:hypothetical protein
VKVILHIGPHKTGTTSIQAFLHRNSAALRKHGFFYPQTQEDGQNHHDLVRGLRDPSTFLSTTKRIQELLKESESSGCHSVILSSEMFVEHEVPIHLLKSIFIGWEVVVLAYIRRPDDHISASYAQLLREPECRRTQTIDEHPAPYDSSYQSVFPKWFPHFAPGEMVIAPFDPTQWLEGNLIADFCQMIGLDSRIQSELGANRIIHRNKSLPAGLQEVLRRSNALLGLSRELHEAWCGALDELANKHPEFFSKKPTEPPPEMVVKLFEELCEMLPIYRPYFRSGFDERFLYFSINSTSD